MNSNLRIPLFLRRHRIRMTAMGTSVALVAGLVNAPLAQATPTAQSVHAPVASAGKAVPVVAVARHEVSVPKMTPAPKPSARRPQPTRSRVR